MPFDLTIVTPRGEAYRGPAERVILPGAEGQFGVLTGHERFLTPLNIGAVEIHTNGEALWAAIADGFAEVTGEQVTVLVESCELAEQIDVARAELARDRARERLASLEGEADAARFARYEAALKRALVRVDVSHKAKR
ncbi:MAG TPA: ATP synthase F1 subunit epsilon [Myxococcota bacterium]